MIFTGTGKNHSSTYLYTQKKFNWGVSDYTNYMSFYVGMAIIRTFITTPLYCYGLKLHDCMLGATGLIMSIANNGVVVSTELHFFTKKIANFVLETLYLTSLCRPKNYKISLENLNMIALYDLQVNKRPLLTPLFTTRVLQQTPG